MKSLDNVKRRTCGLMHWINFAFMVRIKGGRNSSTSRKAQWTSMSNEDNAFVQLR